ncbi:unnamed protein product [Notodromas monacha]|uniref:DNA primase n=1 Tax=Notodromas monacha TaxID=399045 RepID=A0A7R9GAP3_9CRUS|nr:unnamed protein product [Notodromas monacha]CAG0914240.1 unnamed protein product [Notodromas monacha]
MATDEFLREYYKRFFPFDLYYRWMSYGNVEPWRFANREFAYGLPGDIFVRYRSFFDAAEMKADVVKTCPERIDIGPIYNNLPKHHNTNPLTPRERELCFDIDLSDYDDVRSCCSGAKICEKCWKLMAVAVKTIDRALRDDFGFQHLLWVFSGRRGVHCWVGDEVARQLDSTGRSAVAEYLTVVRGGAEKCKKVILPESKPIHPLISNSLKIIDSYFTKICLIDQDLLHTEAQALSILNLVGDEKLKNEMVVEVNRQCRSEEKWQAMEEVLDATMKKKTNRKFSNCLKEIKLQFLYPRLDINVTKGFNHLLKAPFCIHPGTKRVCVPFNPESVDSFTPEDVPLLDKLISERTYSSSEGTENKAAKLNNKAYYRDTSLAASIDVFEKFVLNMESSWRGKLKEIDDQRMEF